MLAASLGCDEEGASLSERRPPWTLPEDCSRFTSGILGGGRGVDPGTGG